MEMFLLDNYSDDLKIKNKFLKSEVDYHGYNTIPFKCKTCVHYLKAINLYGPSCKEVVGHISPNGNCDIWYTQEEE